MIARISRPTVIDEIQRAPDLMLSIKARLDENQDRGQFLLTGSANLLALPTIRDALPGRVEYVRLWTMSQAEIAGTRPRLIESLFAETFPDVNDAPVGRHEYADRVVSGGFPEGYRRSARSRMGFFDSYLDAMMGQDVGDIANVRSVGDVGRTLRALAARSANLLNFHSMASPLGIDDKTAKAYVEILENLFLVRRHQGWHANMGKRQVLAPKTYITDSGLLAHLLDCDAARIIEDDALAGLMFESFAVMELVREAELLPYPATLYHYRDKEKREVDLIVERYNGTIVAIEIKSGASLHKSDFRGLTYLREQLGDRFIAGIVLYTGRETLPFGDRLAAVPLAALWST
jgi:predicted AAA+ superfamily ATPase